MSPLTFLLWAGISLVVAVVIALVVFALWFIGAAAWSVVRDDLRGNGGRS